MVQKQVLQPLNQLKSVFGISKNIPKEFKSSILTALSFYPELKNESIDFILVKSKLPYFSRPRLFTLLPFVKRKYIIGISTKSTVLREPTLLSNLSKDAQIGAIGHELAHVIYYRKVSTFQIILDGIRYPNKKFRAQFEKMTDEIAIEHGLGKEIYSWSKEVFPIKKRDGDRSKIYYSPEQISDLLVGMK